jgi:acetyltransferase-like isoleucine patch superfamily enzyme
MANGIGALIARVVRRLLVIEAQDRDAHRMKALEKVARIDPSALIASTATIARHSGNSDDISVGAKCSVHGHILVMPQGGRVVIGEKCLVGPGSRVWSARSIDIGRYVMISHNVNIHDNISHSLSWSERRTEIDQVYPGLNLMAHGFDLKAAPIVIEDDVWIGYGASVMKGVRIGRGAVIGAGAMVTQDVAPFSVVIGNPMRVVRVIQADA